MKSVVAFALALTPSISAAQDLVFDISHTRNCIASSSSPWQVRDCIGASANVCMGATPGGGSTIGMSGCIDRELQFWDAKLNETYQSLRAKERREDADYGSAPGYVNQANALRDMQRSWIAFRDATCDYERAQWSGGTGGGPATVGCLMRMTAEQTLYLDQVQSEY